MISMLVILLFSFTNAIRARFLPHPLYFHFICLNKAGAAAQSRVIRLLIQELPPHDCFIDSDHLVELDQLYSAVRGYLNTLLIYLTGEIMSRPSCIGEMTTAVMNEINIVVVHCSSFIPFTGEKMAEPGLSTTRGKLWRTCGTCARLIYFL